MLRLVVLAVAALASGTARAVDVELGAFGGATTRTQENETLAPAAPLLGVTSLAWVSGSVGLGVLVEYGRWVWTDAARGGGGDTSLRTLLMAGALRWSPLRGDTLQPFLQAAAGYAVDSGLVHSGDGYCHVEPSPLRVQLTVGADVPVAAWARMGASGSVSGGAHTQGCLDIDPGYEKVSVTPGWMFSGQLTFTTLWDDLL